jgi:DNA repair protein RecO (recombination protein O)
MALSKTEGIVLQTLDFKEYDQIVTVFTPLLGIQKFIYKGSGSAKKRKCASFSPLIRGEFVYQMKNSDLLVCRDLSVLSHFLSLRKNLECLEMACEMAKAVLATQLPGKPAPRLYLLFSRYLEELHLALRPKAFAASFLLKTLRHDGQIGQVTHCSFCEMPLDSLFLNGGESFCWRHAREGSLFLSKEERNAIERLLVSQALAEIKAFDLPDETYKKVKIVFEDILLAG